MELRIGASATGENFHPRPGLIAKLLRALQRGHVAFLGPRRTGKTSCLKEINANPEGYLPILLDLERHDTVEAWFGDMIRELRVVLDAPDPTIRRLVGKVGDLAARLGKIEVLGIGGFEVRQRGGPQPWRKAADEFLALLVDSNLPVLFLLDEFPTFLKLVARRSSRDEVEAVLNWFRSARDRLADRQARFLVTGSIGLKGVLRGIALLPAVNEFDTVVIPPLTDPEALSLLEALAQKHAPHLDLEGRQTILSLLGANWPILIQLFVSELEEAAFAAPPKRADLERIYRERLVAGSRNQYCDGMFDRLKDIFTPSECRLAREILKAVCRAPGGLGRGDFEAIQARLVPGSQPVDLSSDELDHVLETLEYDGYLLKAIDGEQRTRFGSNILRDFWRRKTS